MPSYLIWLALYIVVSLLLYGLYQLIGSMVTGVGAQSKFMVGFVGGYFFIGLSFFTLGSLFLGHFVWLVYKLSKGTIATTDAKINGAILFLFVLALGISYFALTAEKSVRYSDPTALDPRGLPIIFEAVVANDTASIEVLLANGADINARGFQQSTPVIHAAQAGLWNIVDMLLEAGADPTLVNNLGHTLPYLTYSSNTNPGSELGAYLVRVQTRLDNANLRHWEAYTPQQVKEMRANNQWPPRE